MLKVLPCILSLSRIFIRLWSRLVFPSLLLYKTASSFLAFERGIQFKRMFNSLRNLHAEKNTKPQREYLFPSSLRLKRMFIPFICLDKNIARIFMKFLFQKEIFMSQNYITGLAFLQYSSHAKICVINPFPGGGEGEKLGLCEHIYQFASKIENTLKELYSSISTLAQKLVLTLLNNEFTLKILNSTPFGRKIRKHFRPKNHKSHISGELSGFMALL